MPTPSVMHRAPQIGAPLCPAKSADMITASALLDLAGGSALSASHDTDTQPLASTSSCPAIHPFVNVTHDALRPNVPRTPLAGAAHPSEDLNAILLATMTTLLADLARGAPTATILAYFSALHEPVIQHAPARGPSRASPESRMYGLNAVRSYFDLLATHFDLQGMEEDVKVRRVWTEPTRRAALAEVHAGWRWRAKGQRGAAGCSASGCQRPPRGFNEEFELEVVFDEEMKVASFLVATTGGLCAMEARNTRIPLIHGMATI
ncbi:hypothetical protein HDZ31DRAFT_82263 [Schizophyllum fasciatum]